MILPQADTTWFTNQLLWTSIFFGLHTLLSYRLFIPSIMTRKRFKAHEIRRIDNKIQQINDSINELNIEIDKLRDYEVAEKESILFELQDEANHRWAQALIDNQKVISDYKIMINHEIDKYIENIEVFSKDTKEIGDAILAKFGSNNA